LRSARMSKDKLTTNQSARLAIHGKDIESELRDAEDAHGEAQA